MKFAEAAFALAVLSMTSSPLRAERCSANAEVERFWEVTPNFKYKVKFTVESSDCDEYSCRGYIKFRSHYSYLDGDSNSSREITAYTIHKGQSRGEVVKEIIPSSPSLKINLDDIEVGEVSCSTP